MALDKQILTADLCVVGGGMAGISVAITAARAGVKVVLVHERPMYGGNASGEIRMWVCGAQQKEYRETGLTEEINLHNYLYNPTKNAYLWNSVLYEKVNAEENITPLLNCTCFDAKTEKGKIRSITAYQMTTQTLFEVQATNFADCSGDSILAPLTGAEFMYGREGQDEYNEPMKLHSERDKKTMGNSCLIQARKTNKKVPFRAPSWVEKVSVEKLKSLGLNLYYTGENFWYIELGGELDVIKDAEHINQRLIALCLGIWDTVKNSGEFDADEFELEFLGFLGAKRESRRMKGEYVLTANDILDGGKFPDVVAYGGWPLDDHNPKGFDGDYANTATHLDKVYGIPYRCLYSANIDNLFFAGRNISATHMAMSSARVMATCTTIGQAVGGAAWLCKKYGVSPCGVGKHIQELQQFLLLNDCYLPYVKRQVSPVTLSAKLTDGKELLRNGEDRTLNGKRNSVTLKNGEKVTYFLDTPTKIQGVKLVFESDLERTTFAMDYVEKFHSTRANILDDSPLMPMPSTLAKAYAIELTFTDGTTQILQENENVKRNVLIPVDKAVRAVTLQVCSNWGNTDETDVFAFELYE